MAGEMPDEVVAAGDDEAEEADELAEVLTLTTERPHEIVSVSVKGQFAAEYEPEHGNGLTLSLR